MSIQVLQKPRQSGKSTHCIKWWAVDPEHRAVIVASHERAKHLRHQALKFLEEQGSATNEIVFEIAESFIGYEQANRLRGRKKTDVIIDQADHILQSLVGTARLAAVTLDA